MNTNMIIARLAQKNKGQFFKISYITDVPMTAKAKREGHVILKYTYATVRWGIKYKNLKAVKEKDEAIKNLGVTPKHELSWGQWDSKNPGLIINHKNKQYVRLYMAPNKPKSTYYLDGKPISIEELKKLEYVQNSYWNKEGTKPDCLTIKAENIQEIF